ncbi:MAG: cobalamin-binding protein [Gammaproteobacteria bacterium RIFOXYD12_FULL_61_37]|nr:MAG: cobalamin-binding protein [Gammaproteobacteria bacterium RIFOXYD12_FULL_61_37]
MPCRCSFLLLYCLLLIPLGQLQAVEAIDDSGNRVELDRPARRIVSLSPHATEMLFAAGGGGRLVGAVDYSDFPPEARKVPQIGGYHDFDLERVVAMRPDLVVAWSSGNGVRRIEELRRLGLKLFVTEPASLEMIARDIAALGVLAGSESVAKASADSLLRRRDTLDRTYRQRPPVPVFYQIWNSPLMTLNGDHLISRVIELCGGRNVFSQLPSLTPTISPEGVLAADPEVILAGGMNDERPEWLDDWRRWPSLSAVQRNNLFHINPDLLQRNGPRIIEGAERLCALLEQARGRRP